MYIPSSSIANIKCQKSIENACGIVVRTPKCLYYTFLRQLSANILVDYGMKVSMLESTRNITL